MLIAEDIQVEWDEGGLYLHVDGETWRVADPEQLYDRVKAAILPWLMERDEAFAEFRQYVQHGTGPAADYFRKQDPNATSKDWRGQYVEFRCDPDESGGYDISDPKSEGYHDRMSEIWDSRAGK